MLSVVARLLALSALAISFVLAIPAAPRSGAPTEVIVRRQRKLVLCITNPISLNERNLAVVDDRNRNSWNFRSFHQASDSCVDFGRSDRAAVEATD